MAEPVSVLTESHPGIWGVLRTGPPSPRVPENDARALADALGGLVAVGSEFPAASTVAVELQHHATPGRCLAAGLRELPPSADVVVWFGGRPPDDDATVAVRELCERLEGCDAALFAMPVTEAIKDVRDRRIRQNVPREGLCVPVPPLVVRASVARSGLLELLDLGHDPMAALSVGGLTVEVIPMEAAR